MKTLILGGARSGKSQHAEKLALASGKSLVYVATGEARDAEMSARIAHHQERREGLGWRVEESPLELSQTLTENSHAGNVLLIDCLTLWLSNCLGKNCWSCEKEKMLEAVNHFAGELVLVSNEVGSGIVPLGSLSRQFVDESGWLHQELASMCDTVSLVVAGLALNLKSPVNT